MKLSIITINLNNVVGLKKTVTSIFSQSFSNFEFIIIDGGSTDGSIDLILSCQNKITSWVSEKDYGIYNAMNKGIKMARGEYLLFLNSGDILVSFDVLEKMMSSEDGTNELVYGNLKRRFPDGFLDTVDMPELITLDFLTNMVLCHPVTFIKKSLFLKHGMYREDLEIVSDWAFILKIFVHDSPKYKYKNILVSEFSMDGISSDIANVNLISYERKKIIDELFPKNNVSNPYVKRFIRILHKFKNYYNSILIIVKRYYI